MRNVKRLFCPSCGNGEVDIFASPKGQAAAIIIECRRCGEDIWATPFAGQDWAEEGSASPGGSTQDLGGDEAVGGSGNESTHVVPAAEGSELTDYQRGWEQGWADRQADIDEQFSSMTNLSSIRHLLLPGLSRDYSQQPEIPEQWDRLFKRVKAEMSAEKKRED